jgi:hydrogenase small subunit/[NiFe] hydrogenase small subunit
MTPFYERLPGVNIPGGGQGIVDKATKTGKTILGVTAAAVGIHAAAGIGKRLIKGKKSDEDQA